MAAEGRLFVMKLEGFWADIGTPSAFIEFIPTFLDTPKKVLIDPTDKVPWSLQVG
jgi:NDP-sugar pyrophosphorylase family protein